MDTLDTGLAALVADAGAGLAGSTALVMGALALGAAAVPRLVKLARKAKAHESALDLAALGIEMETVEIGGGYSVKNRPNMDGYIGERCIYLVDGNGDVVVTILTRYDPEACSDRVVRHSFGETL